LPVVLHAEVTYYDPENGPEEAALFVRDSTGGVYVRLPKRPVLPLRGGTQVEITGVSEPGNFASSVGDAKIRVLGQPRHRPRLPRVTLIELQTGADDCLWVEVAGDVHSVAVGEHYVIYQISTDEGPIAVRALKEAGVDYMRYLDAKVAIRGAVAVDYNKRRQMTGVHLFSQSVVDITVIRAGGGDPFGMAIRPIEKLSQFDPAVSQFMRVHLRGKVILDWPGQLVCLQEASSGVCIQTEATQNFPLGSMVEASGFSGSGVHNAGLQEAMIRGGGSGNGGATAAKMEDLHTALSGSSLDELVSVDGELVGVNAISNEWQLVLEADGIVFTAVIPKDGIQIDPSEWRVGSRMRVVGVCENIAAEKQSWVSEQQYDSFRILMRTPADAIVLRSPSWWNKTHTYATLSGALVFIVAVLGWVILLRRRVAEKTQELRASELRYRHLAHHDSLTGLPNRAWFYERSELAMEQARRSGRRVGLLLLDLDHFKPVNDTMGHDAGDAMLRALADRVSGAVRKIDIVARLGGDEFAVLLVDVSSGADAEMVANKILAEICRPVTIKNREIPMSASIGVCVFPEDGGTVTDLLRCADLAMYQSKKRAGGGVGRYRAAEDRADAITPPGLAVGT
jgi:diguanylate cyclase (GGDEF)-like protein